MSETYISSAPRRHQHVFLGAEHEASERRTWAVIWLCGAMMIAEIVGGLLFGSIALVADGMHMSTPLAHCCSPHSLTAMRAGMPMIRASRSGRANWVISPDSPARSFWRSSLCSSAMSP